MNISNNWWAGNTEGSVAIWDETGLEFQGLWQTTQNDGNYISNRNFSGRIAVIGTFLNVHFLSTNFIEVASDQLPTYDNNYSVVACLSNFYTIVNAASDFVIRRYTDLGVYTTDTWAITGSFVLNRGAVLNDQIFYWSNDDTIFAWDLNTDSALPDLVTLTGFTVQYIKATSDSKIAVIWLNDSTSLPSRLTVYNTDGSVYANADYINSEIISISPTNNWAAGKIWISRLDPGSSGFLLLLNYSAGGGFIVEQVIEVPRFGDYPPNAGFGFYPLVAGSGQIGGLYKLIPNMKHDEVWTGEVSYGSIKKPDPYAITALFGDEP